MYNNPQFQGFIQPFKKQVLCVLQLVEQFLNSLFSASSEPSIFRVCLTYLQPNIIHRKI